MELVAVLHKMGGGLLVGFANACRQQRHHPGHGIVELYGWKRFPRSRSPTISPTAPNALTGSGWKWFSFAIPPFSDSVVSTSFLIYLFGTSLSEFQLISPFSCSLDCVHFPTSRVLPFFSQDLFSLFH